MMLQRLKLSGMIAGAAAAGALGAAAYQRSKSKGSEQSAANARRRELLAKTTTDSRLKSYETVHPGVSAEAKEHLTESFMTLARVVPPSSMRRLTVEIVNQNEVAVSFRVPETDPVYIKDQISSVLAAMAGAAPEDKDHLRDARYAILDKGHSTSLRTSTGANVELHVRTASGVTTVTLTTARIQPVDASRLDAAVQASNEYRDIV